MDRRLAAVLAANVGGSQPAGRDIRKSSIEVKSDIDPRIVGVTLAGLSEGCRKPHGKVGMA